MYHILHNILHISQILITIYSSTTTCWYIFLYINLIVIIYFLHHVFLNSCVFVHAHVNLLFYKKKFMNIASQVADPL